MKLFGCNIKTKQNRMLRICLLLIMVGLLVMLMGCGQRKNGRLSDSETYLYYVSADESSVQAVPYDLPKLFDSSLPEDQYYEKIVRMYIDALSGVPRDVDLKSPIDSGLDVVECTYMSGQLTLDFNKVYSKKDSFAEVLRRAAIVQTLLQIDGVEGIAFTVEGLPITDSKLVPIGVMTADSFVSNPGAEINSYETTTLELYFADESGTMLAEAKQNVGYISNISMERLVVDRIIAGPLNDKTNPVVSPTLKVINVTTKDGICYINFDSPFLTKTQKVTDEVIIYSFVNSLTELPNVSKVQFMIDSETEVTFGDHIYLSDPFERNLEIVQDGASTAAPVETVDTVDDTVTE